MRDAVHRVGAGTHRDVGSLGLAHSRERILAVATDMFAQRGFHATTIRDLTALAEVNTAAVNYHFGGKEELYRTVIQTALQRWSAEVSGVEDLMSDYSLESFLTYLFEALVTPVFERPSTGTVVRLLAWSLLDRPPGAASGQINAFAVVLARLLERYLAPSTSDSQRLLLAQWLIGQCLLLSPDFPAGTPEGEAERAELIRTSVRLALGGMQAVINAES